MKSALLALLFAVGLFASNSQEAQAQYYYSRMEVNVQFQFVAYVPQRPQMCYFDKLAPHWSQQCGVQAGMVAGCTMGPMGYMCGGAAASQVVCAWRLDWVPQRVIAPCNYYY